MQACAGMVGTLNQVQKGQMCAGARRCGGDSEPSAKRHEMGREKFVDLVWKWKNSPIKG